MSFSSHCNPGKQEIEASLCLACALASLDSLVVSSVAWRPLHPRSTAVGVLHGLLACGFPARCECPSLTRFGRGCGACLRLLYLLAATTSTSTYWLLLLVLILPAGHGTYQSPLLASSSSPASSVASPHSSPPLPGAPHHPTQNATISRPSLVTGHLSVLSLVCLPFGLS